MANDKKRIYISRFELQWIAREMYKTGSNYAAIDYTSQAIWHDLEVVTDPSVPTKPIKVPVFPEDIERA